MIDKNRMDSAKIIEAAVIGKQESLVKRAVDRDANIRSHIKSRSIIESRGSAMLKAALVDKSRHENKAPTGRSHTDNAVTICERNRVKKQLADLSNRKRTTKKSVLFTEPLVTQLYEYEQACIPGVQEPEGPPESCSRVMSFKRKYWEVTDAQTRELRAHLILPNKKKRAWTTTTYHAAALEKRLAATLKNDLDRYVHLSDKHSDGRSGLSSDDDEHHDMLVIEAAHQEIEDKTTREQSNRFRENTDDFSDDESQPNKPSSKLDGKSLFSSPKVAKVAPYFEDKSQDKNDAPAAVKCNQDCLGSNQDQQACSISKDYFPGFNLIASSFKYLSNQFNKLIY